MTFNKRIQTIIILIFTLSSFAINTPSPSTNGQKGVINVLSPEPMGIGRLSISLFSLPGSSSDYKYNFNNQSIQGAASTEIEDYLQTTTHLSISYGLTEFIDLNLKSSFAVDSKKYYEDDTDEDGSNKSYSGLNNLELGMKYSVFQSSFFNMGVNVFAHLPVSGKFDDDFFFGQKINGENILYRHRNFSEEILYNRKASYGAALLASIGAEGMRTYLNLGYLLRHSEEISDALETGVGLEVATDQVTTIIPDKLDKCPEQPEDMDGFEDMDGCPDNDNDQDGISDINDKCPNRPEDIDGFNDEDGDGINDINDKCPNRPEDIDGFNDEDGCPDFDNDQDGFLI